MATVFIPASLRRLCGDRHSVEVQGATLRQVIENLDPECPGIHALIVEEGMLRPGIQLAVNGSTAATGLMREVPADAEVQILPAMSGGAGEAPERAAPPR